MLDFSVEIKFVDSAHQKDKTKMQELHCQSTKVGIVSVVRLTDLLHLSLSDQVSVKFEAFLIHF